MAHTAEHNSLDDDIRHSLHTLKVRRNVKLVAILVGLVVALFIAFAAVFLAYSDEPEAAKGLSLLPQVSAPALVQSA